MWNPNTKTRSSLYKNVPNFEDKMQILVLTKTQTHANTHTHARSQLSLTPERWQGLRYFFSAVSMK